MFQQQQTKINERVGSGLSALPDMEDAVATNKKRALLPVVPKGKKAKIQVDDTLPSGPAPSIDSDYVGWLAHMKRVWRHARKERAVALAAGFARPAGQTGLLGSMMRQQTFSLTSANWDIVQITEAVGRPGEFKVFLLIKDSFQVVRLRVPRQFYLNLDSMPAEEDWPGECQVEKLSRTLPRNQRALNLVRVTTQEDVFVREESAFSLLLNRPEVDGVYELQVPLLVKAILQLGNSVVPGKGQNLGKGLDKGFDLRDLVRPAATLSKHRYLQNGLQLRYAYLFHANADARHMIGLVLPSGKVRVFIVERGNNREFPSLEKYYSEQLPAVRAKKTGGENVEGGRGVFDYPKSIKSEVTFHAAEDIAFRAVARELISFNNQKQGATLLAIYSAQDRTYFDERMSAAVSHFPVMMINARSADNTFNALGWRTPTGKRFIQHYLRLSTHVRNQIDVADRFDLPLCNLERDETLFCADLDFSRRLLKADMVLWWSPAAKPDLGGSEEDANAPQEETAASELSRPGCYTNACLEVELRDLVVDAVLQSALVYELEGAEGAAVGFAAEASHNLDEYSKGTAHAAVELGDAVLPAATFAILKSMVKKWWTDSGKADGASSRKVLDHFWRWISSPSAKSFDPAIHRFIMGLMRKTFSQLVAEFRRLGCDIVFADFGRL